LIQIQCNLGINLYKKLIPKIKTKNIRNNNIKNQINKYNNNNNKLLKLYQPIKSNSHIWKEPPILILNKKKFEVGLNKMNNKKDC